MLIAHSVESTLKRQSGHVKNKTITMQFEIIHSYIIIISQASGTGPSWSLRFSCLFSNISVHVSVGQRYFRKDSSFHLVAAKHANGLEICFHSGSYVFF